MKHLILIITLLLFFNSNAQKGLTLKELGLKGTVKEIYYETYNTSETKKNKFKKRLQFNKYGYLTNYKDFYPKSNTNEVVTVNYTYNSKNQIVKIDSVFTVTENSKPPKDDIVEYVGYQEKEIYQKNIEYIKDGYIKKELKNKKIFSIEKVKFDKNDNITETRTFNDKNKIEKIVLFHYDNNQNLKEKETITLNNCYYEVTKYKYNQNNLLESIITGSLKETIKYNKNKDVILRSYSSFKNDQIKTVHYIYAKYDKELNFIEKKFNYEGENFEMIVKRKIEYYKN